MGNHAPSPETIVSNLLRAGFGVEDIHVKTGIHIGIVRFIVGRLRSKGVLAEIYGHG